jgi:hypothetical protein
VGIKSACLLVTLIISLHPLFHIIQDKKYRCRDAASLYLKNNYLSRLATSPLAIFICITMSFVGVYTTSFWFVLPLTLLTWKLFISDRFITLSRGQGAPGYFCFLNTLAICLLLANNTIHLSSLPVILIIQSLILVEYGSIFVSAGCYKFADYANGNSMAFALGLLNPMWSKVFKLDHLITRISVFINFLGPSLQLLAGLLILTGQIKLMAFGYITIGIMFLSITFQTRLSWLCPSIAAGAYINYLLADTYFTQIHSGLIFTIFLLIRLRVMWALFFEYFTQKTPDMVSNLVVNIYRRLLGVIIWKVFTFDIVKYICATGVRSRDFDLIYSHSSHTNVYDSIALAALIGSKNYLDVASWNFRMLKCLEAFKLESLYWIEILENSILHQPPYSRFLDSTQYSYLIISALKSDILSSTPECTTISVHSFSSYMRR